MGFVVMIYILFKYKSYAKCFINQPIVYGRLSTSLRQLMNTPLAQGGLLERSNTALKYICSFLEGIIENEYLLIM